MFDKLEIQKMKKLEKMWIYFSNSKICCIFAS